MAWYDGITSTISSAWDATVDIAKTGISAKAEQSKEEYQNPVKNEPKMTTIASNSINWQKWGVIAAGAGILLTVYKLAK